jgi:glycerophosphoryl diester phosphodiesterase
MYVKIILSSEYFGGHSAYIYYYNFHFAGFQVYLWVANSDEEYTKCMEVGANGIMTDYPRNLRQFLDTYAKEQETKK